jgi:hypothetical protein
MKMRKIALLSSVLAIFVISTAFVHFSPDIDSTNTTTQSHTDAVENLSSAVGESKGSTTGMEKHTHAPERGDQIVHERPEEALRSDAVNTTESPEQVPDFSNNEIVPIPNPIPDGRIFMRGTPPYGYLPTCSQKDRDVPFVPAEPD